MPWSDPETRAKYHKGYYAKNKAKWYERNKRYVSENREDVRRRMREYNLQREYGLSSEGFDGLLNSQSGMCAICSKTENGMHAMHVDHCHALGYVRGLLCKSCNMKLGWFEKNRAAVLSYLDNQIGVIEWRKCD